MWHLRRIFHENIPCGNTLLKKAKFETQCVVEFDKNKQHHKKITANWFHRGFLYQKGTMIKDVALVDILCVLPCPLC
jgi:hypothetical protein